MTVSVIVPFAGDAATAIAALEALSRIELGDGDEIVFVDNTPSGVAPRDAGSPIEVVHAPQRRSAYFARNAGVTRARGDWLLFIDADCVAPPSLVRDYFSSNPGERVGILAGELVGDPAQTELTARWSRSRRGLRTAREAERAGPAAGVTGNMAVRREAWDEVGGFPGDVRSDADIELCWRIQAAGWSLEHRPDAVVLHRDPQGVRAIWRQAVGYGAGRRWIQSLHPDSGGRPPLLGPLIRAGAGALVWALTLRFERAAFKLLDGVAAAGLRWGYTARSNKAA